MKKFSIFSTILVSVLLFSACAPAASIDLPEGYQERVVTIGFTTSNSGKYISESTAQGNGVKFWIDQVNRAGGIRLSDGTVITLEARTYDDQSNKELVPGLYEQLIQDGVDFLISPYSSTLTEAVAGIADQNSKIMIEAGSASDATHEKGYTHIYQIYTPASRYLTGMLDLLASIDSSATSIAIVYEEDVFATHAASALRASAESLNYRIVLYKAYESGTTDFTNVLAELEATNPDVIIGGGHYQDGIALAQQLYEDNLDVKLISLLVAPADPKFMDIGAAAINITGPSQWEPSAGFSRSNAQSLNIQWYGPETSEFVQSYQAEYNETPSYFAAGGYCAGLILQRAIEEADSLEGEAIREALDIMDVMTFFGRITFDTQPERHGLQIGRQMVYIQWQEGITGIVQKQVIWPIQVATAPIHYPLH